MHKTIVPLALSLLALAGACRSTPPSNPEISEVRWITWEHPSAGFRLQVPESWTVQSSRNGVRIRNDGYPVLQVAWLSPDEARGRGLWAGKPRVAATTLAGKPGDLYVYRHYDGPFWVRVVSHVIERDGRELALEFRTDLDEPDAVQRHIRESFEIVPLGERAEVD